MRKLASLSALVGIIMLFALNTNAITITGIATLDGSKDQVGLTNLAGDKIIYYIPLGGTVDVSGVYGDTTVKNSNDILIAPGYGMSQDTANAPLNPGSDPVLMDMFLYYKIGQGNKGVAMNFWFKDLDLAKDNDPVGFFETLEIKGADTKINDLYTDWSQFDSISTRSQFGTGNNYIVDIDGLNIMPDINGDFWLNLQFRAHSDFTNGTWTNKKENLRVTMETANIPEPATIALFGIGLAGLAGVAARKKWKKKAVDKG